MIYHLHVTTWHSMTHHTCSRVWERREKGYCIIHTSMGISLQVQNQTWMSEKQPCMSPLRQGYCENQVFVWNLVGETIVRSPSGLCSRTFDVKDITRVVFFSSGHTMTSWARRLKQVRVKSWDLCIMPCATDAGEIPLFQRLSPSML